MSFTPEFLDEVRARVPLAEIVGKRVRLVRKGREFSGLCPFHNEKTPSFTVNEDKGFYHCFGCGAHGDAIGFVMRTEGLSFPESVEKLAGIAGLDMPARDPRERERAEESKTLHALVEAATAHFENQLRMPAGKSAMDYVRGRGLDDATIKQFRLGYAGESEGGLRAALKRAGFDDAQMIAAGVVKAPEGDRAPFEYFRNRLMFPITDRRGRVVAFGGRVLGDGQPKYLNSPDSELFHKGRLLYGFAQARGAAHEAGDVIVVEGYMDVIALAQAGFKAAVAPLGTALTEDQIAELWRLAPEPILCFDGDAAGQRAAARAIERALPLLKPGHSLRFVTLPAGDDPDTLVRRRGVAAMAALLKQAEPLAAAVWRLELEAKPLDTPERRADLHARLRRRVGLVADQTVREFYRRHFAEELRKAFGGDTASQAASRNWGQRGAAGMRGRWSAKGPVVPMVDPPGSRTARGPALEQTTDLRRQQILIALLINHPGLIEEHRESLTLLALPDPDLDNLRAEILHLAASHQDLDGGFIERHFSTQGESVVLAMVLNAQVMKHADFAQRDAPIEAARGGLVHLINWFGRYQLEAQLAEAERLAAVETTETNWARADALRRSLQALNAQAAELEAEGDNTLPR